MIEVLLLQIRKFYCFRALFNLKNLVKGPICLKNFDKPICIDHILTNHPYCFSWFMCVSCMALTTVTYNCHGNSKKKHSY